MSIIKGTPKHNRRGSSKGLEEGSENSKSLVRENREKRTKQESQGGGCGHNGGVAT